MRIFKGSAIAAVFMLLLSVPANAQDFDFNFNDFSKYLKHLPPIINSVRNFPAEPGLDDEVLVKARVGRIHFGEEDYEYVEEVILHYTYDFGETWEEIDMDQDAENERLWTAGIEAPGECAEAVYYIVAKDSAGNIAMEVPPEMALPGWNPESDDSPFDFLPRIYDHEDAPDKEIPSYLDVLGMSFGFDDDNLYFRTEYESPMMKGLLSPVDANFYAFIIINRSLMLDDDMFMMKPGGKGSMGRDKAMKMAKSIWAWYYAPIAEAIPPIEGIKIPGVALVHAGESDWEKLGLNEEDYPHQTFEKQGFSAEIFDKNGFEYDVHDNFLDLTIERALLGESERNTFTFATINVRAAGSDLMNIKPYPGDVSYSVSAVVTDHYYNTCPGEDEEYDEGFEEESEIEE